MPFGSITTHQGEGVVQWREIQITKRNKKKAKKLQKGKVKNFPRVLVRSESV